VSRGSPVVPIRIPVELLDRIERQIRQRNHHTHEEPWTLSDFIRVSVERNLSKMCRSRRGRPVGD
jgi:hypothetical protein